MYKLLASRRNEDVHIVLPAALLFILSFVFGLANALTLQFDVSNEFFSGNDIHVKLNGGGVVREGRLAHAETLSWSFSISEYKLTSNKYLCSVYEIEEDSFTYFGLFEAFGVARVMDSPAQNMPEIMTAKCIVNEAGAALLSAKTQQYEMIFRWPAVKSFEFYVFNKFVNGETIRLTSIGAFAKQSIVSYGEHLHWTHRMRATVRLSYKCEVALEVPKQVGKKFEILGTFDVFNLRWLPDGDIPETMVYKYFLNEDGAELVPDPLTGKARMAYRWTKKI